MTDPVSARKKPLMTPASAPRIETGHSPSDSLSSRFDGAPERPKQAGAKQDSPIFGGASADAGQSGMPALGAKGPGLTKTDAAAENATPGAADEAARPVGAARGPGQPAAATASPEAEDYSYTYLPSAQHSYDFRQGKEEKPKNSGLKFLLDLALRASAAVSIGYLVLHSNLAYILGLSRRKRPH